MNNSAKHEVKCTEMANLARRFLPLDSWGFQPSDRIIRPYPIVVYNSEWCRLKLVWEGWDMYTGDTVQIYYGRLHAVSDKFTMKWKNEEYYCWHDIKAIANFLDGLSPNEANEQLYVHGQFPQVMEEFKQSDLGNSLVSNQPEWLIRMHAAVWEHFGKRLFELFDLQHSNQWEKYVDFLKKYYALGRGGPIANNPPLYRVC